MLTSINEFLSTSRPCLLLVHPETPRLNDATHNLLSTYDWPHLPIGKELSAVLLSQTPRRRPLMANRWMKTRLGDYAPGPALCTDIDLLFEPSLSLNPVRLFKDAGRITRLIVAWPGTYRDDVLAYAVPNHAHYRTWRNPKILIVRPTHDA